MTSQALNGAYVADDAAATNNTINATPTGSTDTAVLRMNAAGTVTGTTTLVTTAAAGSIISLGAAGIYHISFCFITADAAGNPISAGISFGASGVITADPVVGVANVIYSVDFAATGVALTNTPIAGSAVVRCTQANVIAGTDTIRFHATDSGAGAPVGITAASMQYRIVKTADLSV